MNVRAFRAFYPNPNWNTMGRRGQAPVFRLPMFLSPDYKMRHKASPY